MTLPAVRILLSQPAAKEFGADIAAALGARPYELVDIDRAAAGVDLAFISRDITGLSTKHVVVGSTQAYYDALRDSRPLKWVHIHSAGTDRPIYDTLRKRGVTITTSSGANAPVVAQSALAGILALARRFPQLMAAQKAHSWEPLIAKAPPRDLMGQTAIVVGWGPIGRHIGAWLQALGLKLIVVRNGSAPAAPGVETADFDSFPDMLPRADWLILACPLTEKTRASIGRRIFDAMPRGGHFVNVARGEIVVERELIEALRSGRLCGAYLDVFEHEPLDPQSPLWDMPNVILTPHSSGVSDGNYRRIGEMFLANLRRWIAGQPLEHAVR
jgi:phosphoglycerate dehydrogenase-like enzyme